MSHPLRSAALFALATLVVVATGRAERPAASAERPDGSKSRAVWMARGSFGVMTHYIVAPKGNTPEEITADLNRTVDRFDLDTFVRKFQETGADWLIFTLGQNTGYLCSPNAYLDGLCPGHTSRRDLALEIARRFKPLGKRLILYLPAEQSCDPNLHLILGFGTEGYAGRYFRFVRQYSVKFGSLHHGWWFDGCNAHPHDYWIKYLSAARAGNGQAAVAFSGGEFCGGGSIDPVCRLADYHAGEIHLLENGKIRRDFLWPPSEIIVTVDGKLRKRGQEPRYYLPDGPIIDGIQWHCLLPIDLTFHPAIPNRFCHYTDKELLQFVRSVKAVGGAITINVPIDIQNGRIPDDSHSRLVRLSKALACEADKSVDK